MKAIKDYHFFFIWFGAAISISEILTGTVLKPLGLWEGLIVIAIGHLLGTTLLILGGVIGSRERVSAIASTQGAFGKNGRKLMAGLNVIQLLGWTAVMVRTAGVQLNTLSQQLWGINSLALWIYVTGGLIFIWILLGKTGISALNTTAVVLLLLFTLYIFFSVFHKTSVHQLTGRDRGSLSFGGGLELVIVMPLSWLPLIADYTRFGKHPSRVAMGSWLGYFIGSCWMYVIGLLVALTFQSEGIGPLFSGLKAGFIGLVVILLSTITTTFLDTASGGVSFAQIFPAVRSKHTALILAVFGTLIALIFSTSHYESFLYIIGALFSPLYAIVLCRYFVLKNHTAARLALEWPALLIWGCGIGIYYVFNHLHSFVGATLPAFLITALFYFIYERMFFRWKSNPSSTAL